MSASTGSSRARVALALASGVAVALGLIAPNAHASTLEEITIPARHGEVAERWHPSYPGPPRAKVLLPDGYDPAKDYPLMVLLGGANNTYASWSDRTQGNIAKYAAGLDAIIVMPEGGTGWYTDWWNGGKRADPAWESYILDEVVPQIEERYRIRPQRRWHALAGGSMGGLGATYLGGRLPGYFGSVVSVSGLVDLEHYPYTNWAQAVLGEAFAGQVPGDVEAVSGPYGGFYAVGHNPARLAPNLLHTRVWMGAGDGTPIPEENAVNVGAPYDYAAEGAIIRPSSDSYFEALRKAGVDVTYSPRHGGHTWPAFGAQIRDAIAWGLFEPVDEHPTSWVNDTVATHGELWEFAYRFDTPPDRVVRFRRRGDTVFVGAAGSPVTITTPGGCNVHEPTPATVTVPAPPCARLAIRVRPRVLRAGHRAWIRVTVTPAASGIVVAWGRRHAVTDARGVVTLSTCLTSRRPRRIRATADNFLAATATIRARGSIRSCRRRG
ncbi:MAG: esterase [Solirubrobacterales bacterium]|nr:esterase [Solirubrobacterales bacterium]